MSYVSASGTGGHWWAGKRGKTGPNNQLAADVTALGKWLWDQDSDRRAEAELNLRRYGAGGLRGLFLSSELVSTVPNVRLNITKQATETITAKVGTNRPRPKLVSKGGNWSERRRVKNQQRFLDGVFNGENVYGAGTTAFRDAMLMGTGVLGVYPKYGPGKVCIERVFPLEILVDPVEAVDGNPLNLLRTRFIDRATLTSMAPKFADAIAALPAANLDDLPEYSDDQVQRNLSMVQVWEAFHLPTYDLEGNLCDGRRVLCAEDLLLADEAWEEETFPFAFFHWSPPVRGFWGTAAASEIRPLEQECNTLLQKAQRAMSLAGQPWILAPISAKVKAAKLTNESGLVVEYAGQVPPTITVHQPIHPQIIDQAFQLQLKALQQIGTNEFETAAVKPPGIESGKGLEQLSEAHLVRFKSVSQAYERFMAVDLCRLTIAAARRLDDWMRDAGRGGYSLKTKAGRTWLKIEWKECAVAPDDLSVEVWPTSVLPASPAARAETVAMWQANGWITAQRAMLLLDLPDVESEADLLTADSELVEYQLEQMLDNGKDQQPDPLQDLSYARKRVTFAIERAVQDGVPNDHIDMARIFIMGIDDLEAQAQMAAAAAQGNQAAPGVASAAPAAPVAAGGGM